MSISHINQHSYRHISLIYLDVLSDFFSFFLTLLMAHFPFHFNSVDAVLLEFLLSSFPHILPIGFEVFEARVALSDLTGFTMNPLGVIRIVSILSFSPVSEVRLIQLICLQFFFVLCPALFKLSYRE